MILFACSAAWLISRFCFQNITLILQFVQTIDSKVFRFYLQSITLLTPVYTVNRKDFLKLFFSYSAELTNFSLLILFAEYHASVRSIVNCCSVSPNLLILINIFFSLCLLNSFLILHQLHRLRPSLKVSISRMLNTLIPISYSASV